VRGNVSTEIYVGDSFMCLCCVVVYTFIAVT